MKSPSSGQNRLFNVLKAYTAYDPQVGYCQGMNFIASMLLRVMPDQEDAFWAFVFLMFDRDWRTIFSDDAKKVGYLLADLESHLKVHCKQVYRHVLKDEFASWEASFASQIITLFICDYEFEHASRVTDLFMLDGEQVLVDILAKDNTLVDLAVHHGVAVLQIHRPPGPPGSPLRSSRGAL